MKNWYTAIPTGIFTVIMLGVFIRKVIAFKKMKAEIEGKTPAEKTSLNDQKVADAKA